MDRAHLWLAGTDARWSGVDHRWIFPSGATLTFGYLETPQDKWRYQSAKFQFVGFDEVTEWGQESDYEFLFSRLSRTEGMRVPLRMRCASNPIGPGRDWVKKRFLGPGAAAHERRFVRSRLEDNPHEDQAAYRLSLARLDPITRRALEFGDWEVDPSGRLFVREKLPAVPPPSNLDRVVRFWDMAATAPRPGYEPAYTAGVKVGLKDGRWYVLNVARMRGTPAQTEELLRNVRAVDGRIPTRCEQEGGSSGKTVIDHYARTIFLGSDFAGITPRGEKMERWRPVSAAAAAGNLLLVEGAWNEEYIDELLGAPEARFRDQLDATAGAFEFLAPRHKAVGGFVQEEVRRPSRIFAR